MTTGGLDLVVDVPVAELGGRFTGQLTRQPDTDGITADSKARAVRLELRYFTQGRGDTDRKVASQLEVKLEPHGGIFSTFELRVPLNMPISYDGSLIRVKWEIEARLDVKMARDPKIEQAVVVTPVGGAAVYDRPHPLPAQLFG